MSETDAERIEATREARSTWPLDTIEYLLPHLTDQQALELHRIVCRRATQIWRRDPAFIARERAGRDAARAAMARRARPA